tara:strand:- start:2130 stop:2558 length:429 start_codon:yes stop_codon:yes gene_type:complete
MYNDYCIRTTPALWNAMLTLGERLGVVTLTYEQEADEEGVMVNVGAPTVTAVGDGAWHYIGPIFEPTLDAEGNPVTTPVTEGDAVMEHGNLRTTLNLREVATAMAVEDAEIAAALASLSQYFLLDLEGNARQPASPYNVWAG